MDVARRVEHLLSRTKSLRSTGKRIEILSSNFLGVPYQSNLIGSVDIPEQFVVGFDVFDCVTYMETVLALSLASSPHDFQNRLRKIRYAGGKVDWNSRNHYMTGWIRNNAKSGAVQWLKPRRLAVSVKERVLSMLEGYRAVPTRFECIPKRAIPKLVPLLKTGDLIFFASTRPRLDIFHCGIIVIDGTRVLMRHAARSRGKVVEQELSEFLKANRMAGVIIARPRES
jgi:hypothetical protein